MWLKKVRDREPVLDILFGTHGHPRKLPQRWKAYHWSLKGFNFLYVGLALHLSVWLYTPKFTVSDILRLLTNQSLNILTKSKERQWIRV